MILFKIAYRNIFRQRRRSFFTILTMVGGFVLFSLSVALSNGTYGSIIDTFTRLHTGHIQIHSPGYLDKNSIYKTIKDGDELEQKLSSFKEIKAWAPRVMSGGLAFAGTKTSVVKITGIDPERESRTTTLSQKISKGEFLSGSADNEVVIGNGLADIMRVTVGEEIVLIAQAADGSIANDLFTVRGIVGSNMDSSEQMNCYLHCETAQSFLELRGRIHEIAIVLTNYKMAPAFAHVLQAKLGVEQYDVEPWQTIERQFYEAMQADIKGMWITLFIIMLIVAIGVLNTVLMTILERTREFGVLKALGTRPGSLFQLIVYETTFLAVISVCVGLLMSLSVNYWFSLHGIKYPEPMDMGGMTVDTMRAAITAQSIYLPMIVTFFTSIIVSLFPALRAARIVPVKAMRHY